MIFAKDPPPTQNQKPGFGVTPQQAAAKQSNAKMMEGALKRAKQSGTFSLQGRSLKQFPMELCKFTELEIGDNWWESYELSKLDLSNNEIPEIPEEIATQGLISHLNLASNKLTRLSNGLFQFECLKFLDVAHN